MWKARKMPALYEIVEEKTNRVVAHGLEEAQAQGICDKHNSELYSEKWKKGDKQPN